MNRQTIGDRYGQRAVPQKTSSDVQKCCHLLTSLQPSRRVADGVPAGAVYHFDAPPTPPNIHSHSEPQPHVPLRFPPDPPRTTLPTPPSCPPCPVSRFQPVVDGARVDRTVPVRGGTCIDRALYPIHSFMRCAARAGSRASPSSSLLPRATRGALAPSPPAACTRRSPPHACPRVVAHA